MIRISQNSELTAERTSLDKMLVAVKDFTYEPDKAVRDRFFSTEGRGKVDREGVDAVRDKMFFAGAMIDPASYPKVVIDQMIKSGVVAFLGELPVASPLRGRFQDVAPVAGVAAQQRAGARRTAQAAPHVAPAMPVADTADGEDVGGEDEQSSLV